MNCGGYNIQPWYHWKTYLRERNHDDRG